MNWPLTRRFARNLSRLAVVGATVALCGCGADTLFKAPGNELEHIYSRVYLTDYNTAWQATLDALKRFEKTVQNRQGGLIQTAWIDNTAEKQFIDSFGGSATYLTAKYRLKVSVAPGSYSGKPSVKISILKDQLIQRDMLEGWREVSSDAIEENTFLYRIGRIIFIRARLKQMEEQKMQQVIEEGA